VIKYILYIKKPWDVDGYKVFKLYWSENSKSYSIWGKKYEYTLIINFIYIEAKKS